MKNVTYEFQKEEHTNTATWLTYKADYSDCNYSISTMDNFYAIKVTILGYLYKDTLSGGDYGYPDVDLNLLTRNNFINAVEKSIDIMKDLINKLGDEDIDSKARLYDYILYDCLEEENIPTGRKMMFCYNTHAETVEMEEKHQKLLKKYDVKLLIPSTLT